MNKQRFTTLAILIVLSAFIFTPNASAGFAAGDLDTFKIVGSAGSTEGQNIFTLDQTPYIYMGITGSVSGTADFAHLLSDPNGAGYAAFTSENIGSDNAVWYSFSNWDTIKKAGEWEAVSFFNKGSDIGSGWDNFTVTPEPLAMTLFLIGGAPMAMNLYKKKRKNLKSI